MRFTTLHMKDFRAVRELEITFEEDVTVIVGRNGAGKTSILDALCLMMQALSGGSRLEDSSSSLIDWKGDIRAGTTLCELSSSMKLKNPLSSKFESITVKVLLPSTSKSAKFEGLPSDYTPNFTSAYIRQDRDFDTKSNSQHSYDSSTAFDPIIVQRLSLEKDVNIIDGLQIWWDRLGAQEAHTAVENKDLSYRDPRLEEIRKMVAKIGQPSDTNRFSDIKFNWERAPQGLCFVKKDETEVHVSALSSGERSYLALLVYLAWQFQVREPDKCLRDIAAIVLIDEIELNLHPAWQSEIVPNLARFFPSCQFIITTHSPQVLSGVQNRQVRILEADESGAVKVSTPRSTFGRTSSDLLETVFASPDRFPEVDRLIREFNAAIECRDEEAASERFAALEDMIDDDVPTLLVLRKRLKGLRAAG